jgi:O-acetyl-ADP-ribose deacetylase (regulator of RNase III)
MNPDGDKTCFVIMPFGTKRDAAGTEIDFDAVYRDLIRGPVKAMGFKPIRCDEIQHAGSIHQDMFKHIVTDDLAIVDITMINPNVFYELGVRHALRPSITILIKKRGVSVPFNIQGERVIEYPSTNESYAEAITKIKAFVRAGQNSIRPDSPIFTILQDARKDWKSERITVLEELPYQLSAQPSKRICLITGDIRLRTNIDVWVNSENTNLQMARYYEKSLSAIIRYEGALKDENGEIVHDAIAEELAKAKGNKEFVTPGAVYVTGSGALGKSHGVKRIFHVATVFGVPGSGYQAMQDVEKCVGNALRKMDDERYSCENLHSIVFPMMGTGAGGGPVEEIAPRLLWAAISYLSENKASRVQTVYFSAWNQRDLEACSAALKSLPGVKPLKS